MPFTVNGIEVTPMVNGSVIEKVTVNIVDVIWENWKATDFSAYNLSTTISNNISTGATVSKTLTVAEGLEAKDVSVTIKFNTANLELSDSTNFKVRLYGHDADGNEVDVYNYSGQSTSSESTVTAFDGVVGTDLYLYLSVTHQAGYAKTYDVSVTFGTGYQKGA